jgi:hypothetical protein
MQSSKLGRQGYRKRRVVERGYEESERGESERGKEREKAQ